MFFKKALVGIALAASFVTAVPQAKAEPLVAYFAADLIASVLLDQSGAKFFPFSSFYDDDYDGRGFGRRHHGRRFHGHHGHGR